MGGVSLMAKICKKCGNQLKDTSKFCSKCGTLYVDEPNAQEKVVSPVSVQSQVVKPNVQSQAPSALPQNESGSKGFLFKLVKWVVIIGIVLFAFSAFFGKVSAVKKAADNKSNTVATAETNGKVNETNIAQPATPNKTPIDNGYVNGVGVNLREAPTIDAKVIRTLDHANVTVFAFTKDSTGREWAHVRLLDDGTVGYIAKQYFKHSSSGYRKDTEQAIGQGHIVGTEVIMRNGQAREADPIGVFNKGETVEILKFVVTPNGEQWVKVRRKNGEKGFVFGKYLRQD